MWDYRTFVAIAAMAALGTIAVEIALRYQHRNTQAFRSYNGFLPLAPLATFLGSAALKWVMSGTWKSIGAGGQVIVAVLKFTPKLLDAMGKSPLVALLVGVLAAGCGFGLWGYKVGINHYPVALSAAKKNAVNLANRRADIAIAAIRAEYAKKAEALKCPEHAKPTVPKKGGK